MSRKKRWLNSRAPIAAIGVAIMVAGVPATSLADHDDRGRRTRAEHRLHDRHESCDHPGHYDARLQRWQVRFDAREELRRARYQAKEERRRARYHARLHRRVARHHLFPAWIIASWW